jgi:predicted dehydrogenase
LRIVEQKHLIGAFHDGRVVNRHLGDDYDWFDVFVRESQDVIDCVRRGDTFTITGEDGRRALELSVATLHAAQQVRPVSLPLPATFSMEELP